jgi:hypothetical protein
MKIACIYTVKNEEGLILQNINYHRFLGVTDFFVFLDYSTDRTKSLIQHVPNLRIFENKSLAELLPYSQDKPTLDIDLMSRKFADHNGIRQVFHANMAMELCRNENIEWLVHLDPDELICLDPDRVEKDALADYLAGLDKGVGGVKFKNVEVVPTQTSPVNVFDDMLFKNNQVDATEMEGLPKMEVFNPYTGGATPAGWYWGHKSGKLAVRVHEDAYFAILTSSFQTPGDKITANYLLHYNVFSFPHFVAKYKNFNNFPELTSLGRKVRPLRTLFVKLVNDPENSQADLMAYYQKHIVYSHEDIELIRKENNSAFIEINSVPDFFNRGHTVYGPQQES